MCIRIITQIVLKFPSLRPDAKHNLYGYYVSPSYYVYFLLIITPGSPILN